MESGPLLQEAFVEFAKKVVLFCHITSRIETDPHQNLLQEKGGRGFPYLVFMDAEGNVVSKATGPRTPAGFEATLAKVSAYLDVKTKADGGDAAAKVEVLVLELEMGKLQLAEFDEKVKEAGELSKEQEARLVGLRANDEFTKTMQAIGKKPKEEAIAEAGAKLLEMKKAGHIPTGDGEFPQFHTILLEYAYSQKDVALFEESLAALKERFGSDEGAKEYFAEQEKRLAELKGAGK